MLYGPTEAKSAGTIRGVRMTLDDLRDPGFGGRMWGYDREQVDRLLVAVADSVEKLQRRRQRDAKAMEQLALDVASATGRAEQAEQRLSVLETELLGARGRIADVTDRAKEAEEALAAAQARAVSMPAHGLEAATGASARALAALDGVLDDDDAEEQSSGRSSHPVSLAVRAARALVREARARAAEITADTDRPASAPSP